MLSWWRKYYDTNSLATFEAAVPIVRVYGRKVYSNQFASANRGIPKGHQKKGTRRGTIPEEA